MTIEEQLKQNTDWDAYQEYIYENWINDSVTDICQPIQKVNITDINGESK